MPVPVAHRGTGAQAQPPIFLNGACSVVEGTARDKNYCWRMVTSGGCWCKHCALLIAVTVALYAWQRLSAALKTGQARIPNETARVDSSPRCSRPPCTLPLLGCRHASRRAGLRTPKSCLSRLRWLDLSVLGNSAETNTKSSKKDRGSRAD